LGLSVKFISLFYLSTDIPRRLGDLDGIPGVVPGLVPGIQVAKALDPWERPGTRINPSNLFESTQIF
jgi:hypothetical protein